MGEGVEVNDTINTAGYTGSYDKEERSSDKNPCFSSPNPFTPPPTHIPPSPPLSLPPSLPHL